jgi:ATP diphosphatase
MSELRNPETGSPWDLKQTCASVIPHTLEEEYKLSRYSY